MAAIPFHDRVLKHYFRLGPKTQVKGPLRGPAFWTWLTDGQIEALFETEEIQEGSNFWEIEPPVDRRVALNFLIGYTMGFSAVYGGLVCPGDPLKDEASSAWCRGWRYGNDLKLAMKTAEFYRSMGQRRFDF